MRTHSRLVGRESRRRKESQKKERVWKPRCSDMEGARARSYVVAQWLPHCSGHAKARQWRLRTGPAAKLVNVHKEGARMVSSRGTNGEGSHRNGKSMIKAASDHMVTFNVQDTLGRNGATSKLRALLLLMTITSVGSASKGQGTTVALSPLARSEADYLVYQDGMGQPTIVLNTKTGTIELVTTDSAAAIRHALIRVREGGLVVVQGDLTIQSTIPILRTVNLYAYGAWSCLLPTGLPVLQLGDGANLLGAATVVLQGADGNGQCDFISVKNANFCSLRFSKAGHFRYGILFEQNNTQSIMAENQFEYSVIAGCSKAIYFPAPPPSQSPAFAEGNQFQGGAIFGCTYGIHAEQGTDSGGMYVTGVIDNALQGQVTFDYVHPGTVLDRTIGSVLCLKFMRSRFLHSTLHPFDVLIHPFAHSVMSGDLEVSRDLIARGGLEVGTDIRAHENAHVEGSVEVGPYVSSTAVPFIDFHHGVGASQDFNVRLINDQNGVLTLHGNLQVIGSISKSGGGFLIEHPTLPGYSLQHSFVESPERKNVYDGIAVVGVDGTAAVRLPEYFCDLNRDYRYQLTSIGGRAALWVEKEVDASGVFVIASDAPGSRVSWLVTGVRNDAYAKANPFVPVTRERRMGVDSAERDDGARDLSKKVAVACSMVLRSILWR